LELGVFEVSDENAPTGENGQRQRSDAGDIKEGRDVNLIYSPTPFLLPFSNRNDTIFLFAFPLRKVQSVSFEIPSPSSVRDL
jgi:hypothetical protein